MTAATTAVLPTGWEQKISPDGKAYYVDHNTRTTHWQPPATSYVNTVMANPQRPRLSAL